jgi:hypothetical protein
MPSKKKKSKNKGRKAGPKHAGDDDDDEQKQGALDSQMQRLKIDEQEADDDDEALLEEAIKLAAAEKKDIEEKKEKEMARENCSHGYNPSPSQERFCGDFMYEFIKLHESHPSRNMLSRQLDCFAGTHQKFQKEMGEKSNVKCIKSYFLAAGARNIIDANYDFARFNASCAQVFSSVMSLMRQGTAFPEKDSKKLSKLAELQVADEHTLVQFYKKQIPCSCLDERHEEVKSITKMGYCSNGNCPLPNNAAVRSKMVYCVRCRVNNYCSRECQVAAWPEHKKNCGK